MKTNELFFAPVKKVNCKELMPNANFLSYNNHAIVMEIDGVDTFVNFCSEDYGLVPNSDLFPKIEALLKSKFEIEANYQVNNVASFVVDYKLKHPGFNIGKNDPISPIYRVASSYNSRRVLSGNAGFHRQICTNGLWGLVMEDALSVSHTVNSIENIAETILILVEEFMSKAEEEAQRYTNLYGQKVKIADLEARVKQAIKEAGFYKSVEKDVIARVELERVQNKLPLNNWLIYNAFNYQLNHNPNLNGAPEDKVKKDRAMYAYLSGEEVEGEE